MNPLASLYRAAAKFFAGYGKKNERKQAEAPAFESTTTDQVAPIKPIQLIFPVVCPDTDRFDIHGG